MQDSIEELDRAVAREVFGLSEEQIDSYPWEIPSFSADRNCAAGVLCKLWPVKAYRESVERYLVNNIPQMHGGIVEAMMVCTPEEICKAALNAVREHSAEECPAIAGTDHPEF